MSKHEISIQWDLDDGLLILFVKSILIEAKQLSYPLSVQVITPNMSRFFDFEAAPKTAPILPPKV